MDLNELAKGNPNISVTIGVKELIEAIDYCVVKSRNELEKHVVDANTETYLTADQVVNMLGVSKSTLWHWNNKEYLSVVKIGNKIRYKMSDIKKILETK
jgi:predicted DNA-binding transcriptional regulator AlpA